MVIEVKIVVNTGKGQKGTFLENVCLELCAGYRGIYISKNSMMCKLKIYVFFVYKLYLRKKSEKKKRKRKTVWLCPWKHNVCSSIFMCLYNLF